MEVQNFDIEIEKQILEEKGYLKKGKPVEDDLLTMEVGEAGFQMKAVEYIRIFPPIVLPTGVHARGKLSQVKNKLKTFVQLYNYDWNQIYDATEKYINRYKAQGYAYMQNASNFIFDKNGDSTLALECDTLEYAKDVKDSDSI